MKILIVESRQELGRLWKRHLERQKFMVELVGGQADAIDALCQSDFQVIILDVVLENGDAFAVADFASFRRPQARVIFVTNTSFFSDGSIFNLVPNVCGFLQSETPPEDLAAMVEYHGMATTR